MQYNAPRTLHRRTCLPVANLLHLHYTYFKAETVVDYCCFPQQFFLFLVVTFRPVFNIGVSSSPELTKISQKKTTIFLKAVHLIPPGSR